ncbi:MAG: class I SAM-dependent methyltransferase [Candidatus Omnitrophica bacterium]|nr:class I SAM-dependent methyltransferase [Candidatus Omnitrophota bacterium]
MVLSKRIEEELILEGKEAVQEYRGITKIIGITYILLAEKILESSDSYLNGTILDLGTGLGDFALAVAKKFPSAKVVGLDISEEMLKEAEKNLKDRDFKNVSFCLMDVHRLDFSDNSIDLIVSHGSLHHWHSPIEVFKEIKRVLKENRFAFIVDLRRDAPQDLVDEVSNMLDEAQKRGFLNSIKASYVEEELKQMLKEAGVNNFLLEEQKFSRKSILRNLDVLRNTSQRSERFNRLYFNLWIRK